MKKFKEIPAEYSIRIPGGDDLFQKLNIEKVKKDMKEEKLKNLKYMAIQPRRVMRFENGIKKIYEDVIPTPFDSARAREIWAECEKLAKHGPVCDQLDNVLTPGEQAYVHAVWDCIESGSSSFMTAFNRILNNEV